MVADLCIVAQLYFNNIFMESMYGKSNSIFRLLISNILQLERCDAAQCKAAKQYSTERLQMVRLNTKLCRLLADRKQLS